MKLPLFPPSSYASAWIVALSPRGVVEPCGRRQTCSLHSTGDYQLCPTHKANNTGRFLGQMIHVRARAVIRFLNLRICPVMTQRFIDATSTLLDIAKGSADVFPPLESCLGAIDAFRTHYEVRPPRIDHDLADGSILAKQRRRRKAQGPRPVAYQVGKNSDDSKPRRQPRGGGEARTACPVGFMSLLSC